MYVARFDVEVDLYGSHAIAIILRAITMPFEVFIFSAPVWETSYRASRASAIARRDPPLPPLPTRTPEIVQKTRVT